MVITFIYYVGLFLIFAHPTNLSLRHSPKYTTTAVGGGFLSQTKRGILQTKKLIRDGLYNGLAARQILAHHVSARSATPAPDALRTKFLQNLAAVGEYPVQPRKVALINGTGNGVLNPDHGSNTELLRIYVKRKGWKSIWGLCGDNICKMFDWSCRTAPSSGTAKVASMWTLSPLFNLLFWVPPGNTNYYGTAIWNNSALDNAPGGRFGNIFGSEPGNINESNFQFLLKESLYLITGSKRSYFSQNLNNFTMMPSYSAADLRFPSKNLYLSWSNQYLCGKTPFDFVYAPSSNEQHVSVSQQGSTWFENEVKCAASDLPIYVTPEITQLTGSNPLCTSGTFHISTCKAVNPGIIGWTASPANLVSISANGTQATITKLGSGTVTITAKVNFCNGYSVSASKTMQVGGPIINITYGMDGPCNGSYQPWSLNATSPNSVTSWQWTVDNPSSGSWVIYSPNSPSTNVSVSGGGGISVTATNSCGTSRNGVTIYSNCPTPNAITASPNPSTGQVTVSLKQIADPVNNSKIAGSSSSGSASAPQPSTIRQIKVHNNAGVLVKKLNYGKNASKTVTINLSNVTKGLYNLEVTTDAGIYYEKVVIAK